MKHYLVTILLTFVTMIVGAQNNTGLFGVWTEADYSEYEITHEFFTPGGVSPSASEKYDMTGYIPVKEGDVIVFSGDRSPGIPFIMGYADNQGSGATVLLGNFDENNWDDLLVTEKEVTIPTGTSYVRCSARNTSVSGWATRNMSVIKRTWAENKSVIRVLTIGNSYSGDVVESWLSRMARANGTQLVIGNAVWGGHTLRKHWEDIVEGNSNTEYRKIVNGTYSITSGNKLTDIINDEPWDVITFQQISKESGLYSTFTPYIGYLIDYVKDIHPDAKLGWIMTWAYAQSAQKKDGFQYYNRNQTVMYDSIVSATQQLIRNYPEIEFVVPCGTAVQNLRSSFIGDNVDRDGSHLNLYFGRYLTAYTFFTSLFGEETAMQNSYVPYCMNEFTMEVIRKAALDAIRNPYAVTPQVYPYYDGDNKVIPADIQFNFTTETKEPSGWNNLSLHSNMVAGFKDINGSDPCIFITCNEEFTNECANGPSVSDTPLNMPAEVSKTGVFGYSEGDFSGLHQKPKGVITFHHLNKSLAYDFTFFASRMGATDNRETSFQLIGADTLTAVLNASGNANNTVTIDSIRPDKDGIITLTVSAGPNNNNPYKFYYINALRISARESNRESLTSPEVLAKYAGLGLPLVCITTTDGTEPTSEGIQHPEGLIGASITNVVPKEARMQIFRADTLWYDSGEYQKDESGLKIKHRGNTSAYYYQNKPFKLSLEKKADLIEATEGDDIDRRSKDWVLLNDAERLHVMVANQMSHLIGMEFAPRLEYVNVIINDDYRGIYILSENVKRDKNCRVNVDKDEGYIIEIDAYFWNEPFSIPSKLTRFMQWTLKYPKAEDLTPEQEANIRSDIARLEKAVSFDNYPEVIDVHSVARWILLHDILGTDDSGGSNVYVARQNQEPSSLIRMPVAWDLGSSMIYLDEWSKTHTERGLFISRLFDNDLCLDFHHAYMDEWKRVLQAGMMEQMAQKCLEIPSTAQGQGLKLSYPLHTKRWGFGASDVDKMASDASQWFIDRRQSLDILIKGFEDYVTAVGSPSEGSREGNYVRKELIDGHIIIVTPDGKYTLTGQKL